jgi:hypothetical protein
MKTATCTLHLLLPVALSTCLMAQGPLQTLNCAALPGAGSYSNPIWIGAISGSTILRGCPGLSSGSGYNSRFYEFTLTRPATAGSIIGTVFANGTSPVHPRLATPAGVTLLNSRLNGAWHETGARTLRYLPIDELQPGTYIIGTEKLDSPGRSLETGTFAIAIIFPLD